MPRTLILHGDRRRFSGLVAEIDGGRARVRESFSLVWPENFDPFQLPTKAAELLRTKWPAAGPALEKTVLCLSREDVILRHLDVPDVPDEELPDIVRFQAAARSTLPPDQLLLDYLPLPKHAGHAGRPVLAVTAPKTLVHGLQSILQSVGCEPAVVTFSSIGLAEFVTHEATRNAHQAALLVSRDGSRIELVVLAGRQLLYAHAARLSVEDGASSPASLLSEVSRTLVAAQRLHPQLKIDRAYLADHAADASALIAPLAERIGAPVEMVVPEKISGIDVSATALKEIPGSAEVLIGLALAEANRRTDPFDFLHPRQPPAKVDQRKIYTAVGAAAALLVSTLVGGTVSGMRSSLQQQIESLIQQEADLDEQKIKPGQTTLAAAKLVDDWLAGDVNQLTEFSALKDFMQGTDRMYLSQYTFTVGQNDVIGNVQAFGNAKSPEDVKEFFDRLVDTKEIRIHPRQLTQTGRDEEYPHRFELNADLLPKPKKLIAPPAKPNAATP